MISKRSHEFGVPEMETPNESRGRLNLLKTKAAEIARAALMVGLGLVAVGESAAEAQTHPGKDPGERLGMKQQTSERVDSRRPELPGAHFTFLEKDENGNVRFNPYSLITPAQLEVAMQQPIHSQMTIDIPYQYSRLFDSGKPVREEDHEKLVEYIDQQLKRQFADTLHGFDNNKRVYRYEHGDPQLKNLKVLDIQIIGTASPEGPQSKGPDTLRPGVVDEENIKLAYKRAFARIGLTEERLRAAGFDMRQFEEKPVGAEEIQFSDQEMQTLAELAKNEQGTDDLDKIFNLVIKYNNNQIEDATTLSQLDEIIASKRSVKVTITYEGNREETLIIPIPWLLLIPLAFPRRELQEGDNVPRETKPQGPDRPRPPQPLGPERQLPESAIPQKVREIRLPDPNNREFQTTEERTYIDDMYVYFDDPQTMRRGLNYRQLADSMLAQYDGFVDDREREDFLTAEILTAWRDHDINARREAGMSGADLEAGLDYENQERQIVWARMHARILLGTIKEKRSGPNKDYIDLMAPKVRALIQRRVANQENR